MSDHSYDFIGRGQVLFGHCPKNDCHMQLCWLIYFIFVQKIDSYQNLSKEIASLHITVPLNMLCLNCNDVNQELSARAARLADRMIHYVVDQNRDKNRGYVCLKFSGFFVKYSREMRKQESITANGKLLYNTIKGKVFRLSMCFNFCWAWWSSHDNSTKTSQKASGVYQWQSIASSKAFSDHHFRS